MFISVECPRGLTGTGRARPEGQLTSSTLEQSLCCSFMCYTQLERQAERRTLGKMMGEKAAYLVTAASDGL